MPKRCPRRALVAPWTAFRECGRRVPHQEIAQGVADMLALGIGIPLHSREGSTAPTAGTISTRRTSSGSTAPARAVSSRCVRVAASQANSCWARMFTSWRLSRSMVCRFAGSASRDDFFYEDLFSFLLFLLGYKKLKIVTRWDVHYCHKSIKQQ
jgi:hypothetical protein